MLDAPSMDNRKQWPEALYLGMDGFFVLPQDAEYFVAHAANGNLQAARMLTDYAADCLIGAIPMPQCVADWLADGLRAAMGDPKSAGRALGLTRSRGKPSPAGEDLRDAHALSVALDTVEWLTRPDEFLGRPALALQDRTRDDGAGPAIVGACKVIRELGIEMTPRALKAAYYAHRRTPKAGNSAD
jgi:hypothetical protein